MSKTHLVFNPYIIKLSDMNVLKQALTWKLPALWQLIGAQNFKVDEELKVQIKNWIIEVLSISKEVLGSDLAVYTRINIIILGEKEHKTLEPFRLFTTETSDQIDHAIGSFIEKYSNYENSDELSVFIIGQIGKYIKKKITKDNIDKVSWIMDANIEELKQQLRDKELVYGKYKNGAIIEVNRENLKQYSVKLLKDQETIDWNTDWTEIPSSTEVTKNMTMVAQFTENEMNDGKVRMSEGMIFKYNLNGILESRREYIYTQPLLKDHEFEDNLNREFATLDIETYVNNTTLVPYAIGIFNGKIKKSFYITDYKTQGEMILAVMNYLIKHKIKLIYAHNASNFDNLILAEYLRQVGISMEGHREGNELVKLIIRYQKRKIVIKDSYKILPSSLKELSIAYGKEEKGIFPHSFIKKDLLNYKGPKPKIEFYEGISQTNYELIGTTIDIKADAEKYVLQDCVILYNILEQFRATIYEKYKIDIIKRESIAGIAYKIWTTTIKNNEDIIRISPTSRMGREIRQAYYGGISEVYIPSLGIDLNYNRSDSVVGYYYDVNSLYPYIMSKEIMPIGGPARVYDKDLEALFGFCKAEIEAPELPVLLLPILIKGTIKITTGTWTGWYFSEELKYAKKLGYKIKIIEAYEFQKRGIIFKDYIDPLYQLKSNTTNKATRVITKLLLNSLYGIMGYKDNKNFPITIEPQKVTTTYDTEIQEFSGFSTNIAIAAAITSYARIYMYKYRKLAHYSDTDSIITNTKLPDSDVSNTEIGKFKLEQEILNSVHITSKTYGIYGPNNQIKIATAGIPKSLVKYEDLYNLLIKNENKNISYKGYKTIIDNETIKLMAINKKRKISAQYEARIKVYIEHNKNLHWIGTMPWRVENNELKVPKLNINNITYNKQIVKDNSTFIIDCPTVVEGG